MPRPFVLGLIVLGVVISVTVIPGVFIIDDDNYLINVLAMRQGRLTVANTEGLTPSRELLFFDPGPSSRVVDSTPVASTAPPLYAVLALPFSWLGWRGLVALNTLAYLVAIVLVFLYSRRYATDVLTPWLAATAFAFGGYVIEYTQGVWPQALSIALCTGGIVAAGRAIDSEGGGDWLSAAAAGFLLALATGVRYQNAVVLAVVAGAVFLWSASRWRSTTVLVLAAAGPLFASAAINHARLGSWNPISKGEGYIDVAFVTNTASSLLDPFVMFWARLVDFSVRPPLVGPSFGWVRYDVTTGAHLMNGETLQKAFLQSAPWAILALILFVAAWLPWYRIPKPRRRQVQLLSLITIVVLNVFALSGVGRHEGFAFNQRYLLELLPLAAVGFAWALDGLEIQIKPLLVGSLWGALLAVLVLFAAPPGTVRLLAILKVPLFLVALLGVVWFLGRSRPRIRLLLAGVAGICLGWGLTLHLTDDVAASRRLRAWHLMQTQALDGVLTDGSALVVYSGNKDAVAPLLFDRDIVILDAKADEGKDAPILIQELLARNRRVFVLESGMPGRVLSEVLAGWQVVPIVRPGMRLVQLHARPG